MPRVEDEDKTRARRMTDNLIERTDERTSLVDLLTWLRLLFLLRFPFSLSNDLRATVSTLFPSLSLSLSPSLFDLIRIKTTAEDLLQLRDFILLLFT